jgi:hypothetical protein
MDHPRSPMLESRIYEELFPVRCFKRQATTRVLTARGGVRDHAEGSISVYRKSSSDGWRYTRIGMRT